MTLRTLNYGNLWYVPHDGLMQDFVHLNRVFGPETPSPEAQIAVVSSASKEFLSSVRKMSNKNNNNNNKNTNNTN